MTQYAGWIWWLIVSLGILVTFHEFGHYFVARRCGVKVLRFSVGFGRPLFRRTGRDGTEYVIGWLPLGGYVRMLDEREGDVPANLLDQAFNRKNVFQRFAIVAAGPVFNLVLCIALLWAMFTIGKGDFLPIVGQASGLAAEAGFKPDDRIITVDGQRMDTWTHAQIALSTAAIDGRPVRVDVLRGNGDTATLPLRLDGFDSPPRPATALRDIGLVPRQILLPAIVGEVVAGSAAADAGLAPGDHLVSIDGNDLRSWDQLAPRVQQAAGAPISLTYERHGETFRTTLVARRDESTTPPRWLLGITVRQAPAEYDAWLRYGPLAAVGASLDETWRMTRSTLGFLWRMVRGAVSLENINGPISIAQYANASAHMGLAWFLSFLAMLSLSLCIMNLLPIPILDGGHLLYYLIEMVKGSPVSERMMIAGQFVGMVFLAGLMGLAFYNDIVRLVSS